MNGDFSVESALSLRLTRLARHFDDSSGPASIPGEGTRVDIQVAAPAEARTPNWHRAEISVLEECGWKGRAVEERPSHPV